MISKCIKIGSIVLSTVLFSACGSSSTSPGTQVSLNITPAAVNTTAMPAGAKTFTNTEGVSITLDRAYLVVASTTITTSCDASFTAFMTRISDLLIPSAHAHTTTTPTSTGVPIIINLLGDDGVVVDIGTVFPPAGDYCGVNVDFLAADADTLNLPANTNMIGLTLYIEGSYQDSTNSGAIHISTGAALQNRTLLLSSILPISAGSLTGNISLAVNYDTWFDGIDMTSLELETATLTSPVDTNVSLLLQNITDSVHQLP